MRRTINKEKGARERKEREKRKEEINKERSEGYKGGRT